LVELCPHFVGILLIFSVVNIYFSAVLINDRAFISSIWLAFGQFRAKF